MQVCGVIVTYGDRFHLLSQVINALLKEGVDKIVIIDNGSSEKTQQGIKRYSTNMITHRFEENKGTAMAFKTGIAKALDGGNEFVWLMDDDTLPETGSLKQLKAFWNNFSKIGKENNTALCCYRKDRINFIKAIKNKSPDEILPLKNNFAGFHVKNFFIKLRERIMANKTELIEAPTSFGKIAAAAYGGLFFHKDLVEKFGLPDELYFLYVDDFDFTFRITRNGGEILVVTNSVIHDLESSFYLPAKKKILYHSAFDSARKSSAYYALRNTVYFSKKYLLNNNAIYFLNKFLFVVLITLLGILRGKWDRLKIIRSAMKDGEKGQLGYNPHYKI